MKKTVLIFFLLTMATLADLSACDFCSYYVSLNPNYNQNMIGLRYRYRSFPGQHSHTGMGESHGADLEVFQTAELWARWYPVDRLQLVFSLPVSYNQAFVHHVQNDQILGLGDGMISAFYQVYNSPMTDTVGFRHRFFLGGGIKLPTGMYKKRSSDGIIQPLFQPGTGSVDFLIAGNYMAKWRNLGINLDAAYKINLRNSLAYRSANRSNLNFNLFYGKQWGKFTLMPYTGVYAEMAQRDVSIGNKVENTGGIAIFANIGLDLYLGRFSVNLACQVPFYQHMNGIQGKNQIRLNTGVNIAF